MSRDNFATSSPPAKTAWRSCGAEPQALTPTSPLRHELRQGSLSRAFEQGLKQAGYGAHTCAAYLRGAGLLEGCLSRRGTTLEALDAADWSAYCQELRQAHTPVVAALLLNGARALLRFWARGRGAAVETHVRALTDARRGARALPASVPPTLAQLPRHLEEAFVARGTAEITRRGYRAVLQRFLRWLVREGPCELNEVTRERLTGYRLELQTALSKKGCAYSISTQLGALRGLRFVFSWLCESGILLCDPTRHLRNPRPVQALPRALDVAQVARLLKSLPATTLGLRDRALVELLYGTGLRRAELSHLELGDLDLEQRTLLVRQGKGLKDRLLPLGDKARQAVVDYLELSRGRLLRGGTSERLFLTALGGGLQPQAVTERVVVLGRRCGLKLAPHHLRHSCATHLLRNRASLRHIQQLLGHKSLATTERYTRLEVEDLKAVVKRCHPRERQR